MSMNRVAEEIAVLRARRWSREDAQRVLAAVAASKLTLAAFAREHGINEQRLSWWRSRLREGAPTSMVRFVPAVVRPSAMRGDDGVPVVVRVGAVAVEIGEASPEWVAALVRAVCEVGL